ncbi:hypothetical protein FIV42_15965 [Persicimonas caeni]|uniref:Colicin E3-like ribonuclease domain-containing protein n=1 Tax=Persicimonas caeni TaxID=2292766 RepID=A0A4Y6PV12_PERCE|nr:RHS repeat-associated core domain-containing protein [Persicimonas caeni]QDG52181.1 hypothetical protein FIV42_15965 [Persicimonas caeni]QED33403.1 hypothetical protein FRD00_15960 [Persicimonas caeni]
MGRWGPGAPWEASTRGRQVQTIRPDGAKTLVVFGEVPDVADPTFFDPTPWKTYSWDANDYDYEVDDDGNRTAIVGGAEAHWDTPTSAVVDALGRTIKTVERLETGEQLVTRTTYDIRGNVLTVVDPKGRTAATQFYDLADRKLRNESIDAGTSIAVFDAVGTPIEARDERGALTLTSADEMLRTTHQWGRDSSSESVRLVGRTIFGHEMANPTTTNHLGKPYQHYDEAGVVTLEAYDFKGNALANTREVIDPGLMIGAVDDADSANGYVVDTFRVDWTGDLATRKGELVDIDNSPYRTAYKSKSVFDALNRPVQMTLPADQEDADTYGYGKTITPQFNRAGALQSVQMSGTNTPSVDYIAYNAKGQRILAAIGNGVMTRYAYDPNVFRLKRLRSEKYHPDSTPETGYTLPTDGSGKKYQDIVYSYDAVGNILSTDERVSEIGIAGTDTMVRDFAYDALYRLIEATGRESDVLKTDPWQDQLTAKSNAGYTDSPQDTRAYTETYAYDDVGGLSLLTHQYGAGSQWTRNYTTETGSNRMTGMTAGGNAYTYAYDSVGNLVQENTERHFEWDFGGRMRSFRNQITGSAPSVFAHYSYDAGGERVQKVVCRGAKTTRTVYIGGVFEHQQVIENESVTTENQTLHLMDDAKRVATYRAGPELDGADRARTRYHLGDHLQSSNVVLRQVPENGTLFVNREEYRPYGETAFGSFEYKRYRFTGKEKDEESGLHYHSARYYAPWMARWTAPDPLGMVDGPNLYRYVSGNPIRLTDLAGTKPNVDGGGGSGDSQKATESDVQMSVPEEKNACELDYCPGTVESTEGAGEKRSSPRAPKYIDNSVTWALPLVGPAVDARNNFVAAGAAARRHDAEEMAVQFSLYTSNVAFAILDFISVGTATAGRTAVKGGGKAATRNAVAKGGNGAGNVMMRAEARNVGRAAVQERITQRVDSNSGFKITNTVEVRIDSGEMVTNDNLAPMTNKKHPYNESRVQDRVREWEKHKARQEATKKQLKNETMAPSASPVWRSLDNHNAGVRTDGNYLYTWDGLHGEIEIFNMRGEHLGAMDAVTGAQIQGPVGGRRINDY